MDNTIIRSCGSWWSPHEHVSHSSFVEHIEVHEVFVELVEVQTNTVVEHVDVHSGSRSSLVLSVVIEQPLAENVSMPTAIQEEQVVASLQQQEVHPCKNIQHDLDLWERVREYDKRSAAEDFMPVLNRKQRHELKLQQVLPKQPTKTHAQGDPHLTDQ
uniref:Uncharacterized protein n=1 Tax=Medicago truncatula TaxID=3880 RepID=Q2HU94_MEDTR|nr:hypothetical protein MtrDRAFT_AC149208g40v2 [Medicago truncatula]